MTPTDSAIEKKEWRIVYCTSWEDEPPDTVLPFSDEQGGRVVAKDDDEAVAQFLVAHPEWGPDRVDGSVWAEDAVEGFNV